jgi:beta-phosphoglucomutase
MSEIKACLFDMDGVIVDTARFHFKAWHRLADSLGIQFTEADNEHLKGVSRVDSLEKILSWGNLFLNNTKKIELMELKNKWYLDYVQEVNPSDMLPGVHNFLKELKNSDIKIGLGSSSKNSVLILEKLGIYDMFDVIVDGNKIHMSKPHPEVFERGSQELQIPPHQIVVFEDAISGVEAAINGGFHCIGIGDPSVLSKAKAVVPDMNDMTVAKMLDLIH